MAEILPCVGSDEQFIYAIAAACRSTACTLRMVLPACQGLPENYLAKNDEYIRAVEEDPELQSIEEIDRLLVEAGFQVPRPVSSKAMQTAKVDFHTEVALEW